MMSRVTSGPRQITGVFSSSTRNWEETTGIPPRETRRFDPFAPVDEWPGDPEEFRDRRTGDVRVEDADAQSLAL